MWKLQIFSKSKGHYTLKPQFVTYLEIKYRQFKLLFYKRKKIKKEKSLIDRYYHLKYRIKISDPHNPLLSDLIYESVVPAKAAFFAKLRMKNDLKKKIFIDVVEIDEMDDNEFQEYLISKQEFLNNRK